MAGSQASARAPVAGGFFYRLLGEDKLSSGCDLQTVLLLPVHDHQHAFAAHELFAANGPDLARPRIARWRLGRPLSESIVHDAELARGRPAVNANANYSQQRRGTQPAGISLIRRPATPMAIRPCFNASASLPKISSRQPCSAGMSGASSTASRSISSELATSRAAT